MVAFSTGYFRFPQELKNQIRANQRICFDSPKNWNSFHPLLFCPLGQDREHRVKKPAVLGKLLDGSFLPRASWLFWEIVANEKEPEIQLPCLPHFLALSLPLLGLRPSRAGSANSGRDYGHSYRYFRRRD